MSRSLRSNVSRPASTVAFGLARLITARARKAYAARYHGVFRRPRLLFAIDGALLTTVIILLGVLSWIAQLPAPVSGISLELSAPPILTAAPTPLTVTLRSVDGLTHANVRIRWHLPPGSQILSSDPPATPHGITFLGTVSPTEEPTAHAVVRTFIPQGDAATFGFTVLYTENGVEKEFFGGGNREVASSGLTAAVPEAFQVSAVVAEGAIIPIRVENTTTEPIPFVHVRLLRTASFLEERLVELGTVAPHETRWVYVDVQTLKENDQVTIEWSVGAASRDLVNGSWHAAVDRNTVWPQLTSRLTSNANAPVEVAWSSSASVSDVAIMHPLLETPATRQFVAVDGSFQIPATGPLSGPNHEWFVAPIVNGTILGPATRGTVNVGIPFSAVVRYQSSEGDQLGAGPLPPRVGLETRYWAFWIVGPIDSELENIVVSTTLPPGVTATGNVSASDGGTYTAAGRTVSWSLPTLGTDRARALFGFEISVTPDEEDIGQPLTLIDAVTASARDTHTSLSFTAKSEPILSVLEEFEGDAQKGIVTE